MTKTPRGPVTASLHHRVTGLATTVENRTGAAGNIAAEIEKLGKIIRQAGAKAE